MGTTTFTSGQGRNQVIIYTGKGTSGREIYLNLLQASVEITPATPKTNYLDIEGGDGSLDLTAALGRVYYNDRTITWTFKTLPGQNWTEKQTKISNALNGVYFDKIQLSDDPAHYYAGRVSVTKYQTEKRLGIITVTARVKPWRYKSKLTYIKTEFNSMKKSGGFANTAMPTKIRLSADADCSVTLSSASIGEETIKLVAKRPSDYYLINANESVSFSVIGTKADGVLTIEYREGEL